MRAELEPGTYRSINGNLALGLHIRGAMAEGMERSGDPEVIAHGRLDFGSAADGNLRWAATDLGAVMEAVRGRLDLSPVASAALGRSLAGAALLLRLGSRDLRRLTLEIKGDGPLGRVLAEVDRDGNLRGTVAAPRVDLPPTPAGKLAVGQAVGAGHLQVVREQKGELFYSRVELVSGEIGEDLAHYLEQSEQTRSAVLVGVLAKPDGIAAAGGMLVEVLPGTSDATLDRLERNLAAVRGVSHLLEEVGLDGVVDRLLAQLEPRTRESRRLRYACRCDRERLARHLSRADDEDLADLALADGTISAECQFCGEVYLYTPEELTRMRSQA